MNGRNNRRHQGCPIIRWREIDLGIRDSRQSVADGGVLEFKRDRCGQVYAVNELDLNQVAIHDAAGVDGDL